MHKGQLPCPRLGCCYIFNAPAMLRNGAGRGGGEGPGELAPAIRKCVRSRGEVWVVVHRDAETPGSQKPKTGMEREHL